MDGVGQKQARQLVAGGFLLGLDRRVALQLGLGHEREEGQHELVELGDGAVGEDHGLCRVDAAGQVVEQHVCHVVGDVLGRVAVGDDLVVGDDDVGLDAGVLQRDAPGQGAEIVPEVQAPGGPVAREHRVLARMHREIGAYLVASALGGLEASLVRHRVLALPFLGGRNNLCNRR